MPSQKYKWPDSLESNAVLKIIDNYTDHLCINLIQTKNNPRVFNFTQKNIENVKKMISDTWFKTGPTKNII